MEYRIINHKPLRPPHLLVVAGQIGSGKTKICSLLNQEYGYETVNAGTLLADIIGIPPVPVTPRSAFQTAAYEFVSSSAGLARLTEGIMSRCQQLNSAKITIDGLRIAEVLIGLRRKVTDHRIGVLSVEAPPGIAHRFYEQRESSGVDYESFLAMISAPIEQDIKVIRSMADARIINDQEGALAETLHALMRELGVPRCVEHGQK